MIDRGKRRRRPPGASKKNWKSCRKIETFKAGLPVTVSKIEICAQPSKWGSQSALLRSSEATQFGFDDWLGKTRGILRVRRPWDTSQQIIRCVFRTKYGFWMQNVVSGRHFKMVSPLPFFLESWKIKKLSYLVKVEGKGFSKSSTRSKSLHGARSSSPNPKSWSFFQKKDHLLTGTGNPALIILRVPPYPPKTSETLTP